jgi:hypothetical protein
VRPWSIGIFGRLARMPSDGIPYPMFACAEWETPVILPLVLLGALVALSLLITGAYYFRRMEASFAAVM